MGAFSEKFFDRLADVGPIGLFVLAILFILAYWGPNLIQAIREGPARGQRDLAHEVWQGRQAERDMARDGYAIMKDIQTMQDKELEHLSTLVMAQVRVAEILERIERRLDQVVPRR